MRSNEVLSQQRSNPKTLTQRLALCPTREEALRRDYLESALKMSDIARELDISVSRVSKLIRRAMGRFHAQRFKGQTWPQPPLSRRGPQPPAPSRHFPHAA